MGDWMVKAEAARTAGYICEHCNKEICKCDRCDNYLENHAGFDEDGDEIDCRKNGQHVVPGNVCKKVKSW